LTRLSGIGVPGFGSIVVGFAGFAAAAFVATAFVTTAFVAAAFVAVRSTFVVGSTVGVGIAVDPTAAFEIAEVAARRLRVGLDSSARSLTSLATFVASRCSQLLTVVSGTP
jgi:hypothetical protein